MSIRLSRAHGLNPSVTVCFWCQQDKNEIILSGAAGDRMARAMGCSDGRMPHRCVVDQEPCAECQHRAKTRVTIARFTPGQEGLPQSALALEDERVAQLPIEHEFIDSMLHQRFCFFEPEAFDAIFGTPEELDKLQAEYVPDPV